MDKKTDLPVDKLPADLPDDPQKQLAFWAPHVARWVRRLPFPWGPIPESLWDDVTQQVLVASVEALPNFDPSRGKSLRPWLLQITQRTARDIRKREDFRGKFEEATDVTVIAGTNDSPEEDMATSQYRKLVYETIAEMQEGLRAVFEAVELQELSHEEAAELLDLSKRAVKARVERARDDFNRRMKRKMADRGLAILPFPLGLLARIRASTEHVSEGLLQRLHEITSQPTAGPASGARVASGSPEIEHAPPSPTRGVESFVAGNVTGGVVGGLLVYLAFSFSIQTVPIAERATNPISMPMARGVIAPMLSPPNAPQPQSTASTTSPSVDDSHKSARALLDRALGAIAHGELDAARAALAQYQGRFPADPLPRLRSVVQARLDAAEKNRRTP